MLSSNYSSKMLVLLLAALLVLPATRAQINVLKFQSFQFVKKQGPAAIAEGKQSIYTVIMDAPPEKNVKLELSTVDGYIKTLSEKMVLEFDSTNWNASREIYIMGVDDNVIRQSPYGGTLSLASTTNSTNTTSTTNLTLLVTDTDESGVVIVRKEFYPYPKDLPEGRWAVYEVTLPSKPTDSVSIQFRSLSSAIKLVPTAMVFEPESWNVAQDLVIYALDDGINRDSPYPASFNMSLASQDANFNEYPVPDFGLTVEDNDDDDSIISGSLVWSRAPVVTPRSIADFKLSLTLDLSQYFNVSLSDAIAMPGMLMFGDNTHDDHISMNVELINEDDGYIVAVATVRHEYASATDKGEPWEATYEYCCKAKTLINNGGTMFAVSVTVNLNYHSSPLVPVVPILHWSTGNELAFYYTCTAYDDNPLDFSLGTSRDYHSVQAGSPQGISIAPVTGHMTWGTGHVTEGEYDLVVVVKDLHTNLRVASEMRLRLVQDTVPVFQHLASLFPLDTVYTTTNTTASLSMKLQDDFGLSYLETLIVSPAVEGVNSAIDITEESTNVDVVWKVPLTAPEGPQIVCVTVVNGEGVSAPACVVFHVLSHKIEAGVIHYNGEKVYQQSYYHGLNSSISLVPYNTSVSEVLSLHHMTIFFASHHDGTNETLSLDYQHPSLQIALLATTSRSPALLHIRGEASVLVYLDALQQVQYSSSQGQPTQGDRLVAVRMYDGTSSTSLSSYISLSVSIHNIAPLLSTSGHDGPYINRFYPRGEPVSAVDPLTAFIEDFDGPNIERVTMTIQNVFDGASESLKVTYKSLEAVSLPVIAESLDVNLPFGMLFSGEVVEEVSDTIVINATTGGGLLVGDVDVVVDIRHSWIGDVRLELEHANRRVLLVLSPGGRTCSMDNLFSTTFDSDSSADVFLSKSIVSPGLCRLGTQGLFAPDGDLQNFQQDPIEGEWTLRVKDLIAQEDNGRIVSWGLVLQPLEPHLIVATPPVSPVLSAGAEDGGNKREHYREVDADGRITGVSVHVHLAIPFGATHLYLPTLRLTHPDGTAVTLSTDDYPLCAFGNYTYLIFDDRATTLAGYTDYSCLSLYQNNTNNTWDDYSDLFADADQLSSGSGSASGSGSGSGIGESSASGSGSGEEMEYLLTLEDILDLNISVPHKLSLADIVPPRSPLAALLGKHPSGRWTLTMSSDYYLSSTLVGWSLRVAREPNVASWYDPSTSSLTIVGPDSPSSYQTLLQSVVYDNDKYWPEFLEQRSIATTVSDGQANSTQSLSYITIHHINIDLDPLNTTSAATPNFAATFNEHSLPVPLVDASAAILSDDAFDLGNYVLIITLRNYLNIDEEGINITLPLYSDFDVNESIIDDDLVVEVSSETPQSIAMFESILRTAEYYNDAEELFGASRVVEFLVQDVTDEDEFTSRTASTFVDFVFINDPPVLTLTLTDAPYVVYYTEGQGNVSLVNDSMLSLTDNDHEVLQYLTVAIVDNANDGARELLHIDETLLYDTNITFSYDEMSNTLLLSGEDTLENYAMILSSVEYENTVHSPGKPDPSTRVVSFIPNDGRDDGEAALTLISFAAVNDAPFGYLNGLPGKNTSAVYVEEQGSVPLTPRAVLLDVDATTLEYITVQVLNAHDESDEILTVFSVSEESSGSNEDISIWFNYIPDTSYNSTTSTLTIAGLDTVYQYQEVLKTLTYDNLADEPNPATRLVKVILNDGLLDSEPLYVVLTIENVNDSPYFNAKATPFMPIIYEDIDDDTNIGFPVSNMSYLILDSDLDSMPGIAVIDVDISNGRWQYQTPLSPWANISSDVSLANALVLSGSMESQDTIRFVPNRDFNGNTTLHIVAWDGTDTNTSGSYINAISVSDIDPFSSDALTITLTVTPVNDAPVLDSIDLNVTLIIEDDYESIGDTVISLLQNAYDVDHPPELGVAIINAEQQNGTWQYTEDGGNEWVEFGEVSTESALLLTSLPENDHRIRYVPDRDFNGLITFQFQAWDLLYLGLIPDVVDNMDMSIDINIGSGSRSESGSGSGSESGLGSASGMGSPDDGFGNHSDTVTLSPPRYINTSLSDPVTGPLSTTEVTVTITVQPDNDSPLIYEGMIMSPIDEDRAIEMNHGVQVANIVSGYYYDVDDDHFTGLAVVEVDNRYGSWWYTCDPPSQGNWTLFIGDIIYGHVVPPLPLVDKATLLLSTCWIRFTPEPHFNTMLDYVNYPRPPSDTPYIIAYGWDNTGATEGRSNTYGNDASYANSSHTNEYSANSVKIPITINSINDVPILHLTNENISDYETVFYEDLLSIPVVGDNMVLIDHDHARLTSLTITIYGEFDESPYDEEEVREFIEMLSYDMGSDISGSGSNISGSGSNISGSGSNVSESGSGSGSGSFVDDSPYEMPQPSYISLLQQYVLNRTNRSNAELYCAGLSERREELLIDTTYLDLTYTITSWCPFSVLITPINNMFDADIAQFDKILRGMRYNNSVQEPQEGARTVSFVLSDGVGDSVPANTTIYVTLINDAPILDINDYEPGLDNFVMYVEGGAPLILVNSSGLRLVDFDNEYLQNATVTLVEAPDTTNETLIADTNGTNIEAVYDNYRLYLMGNDTVETYAAVLRTVTYHNAFSGPGYPDERDREIMFVVSDGEKNSHPVSSHVAFMGINDRPFIYTNNNNVKNHSVKFYEGKGPVYIVEHGILHDIDNTTLNHINITILNPIDDNLESLSVDTVTLEEVINEEIDQVAIHTLTPNVYYNFTTSTLTISELNSVLDFRHVLRTIQYNNLANEPNHAPRTVLFIANDGLLDSDPAYTTIEIIPVNDSPYFNEEDIIVPHILEDVNDADNLGTSVADFAAPLIEDDDSLYLDVLKGIAVTGIQNDHGVWQYQLNASHTWTDIHPNTNLDFALLLEASGDTRVRFVPELDFNGDAQLTFVAWDREDDMPEGIYRVALSNNLTDPFSDETRVLNIVVVPVNDRPVLDTTVTIVLPDILEDDVIDRPSNGSDVSVFLLALSTDVDQPVDGHEFGIAVVGADNSYGQWQFSIDSGGNWTNVSSPTDSNAVVLRTAPSGHNRLRFFPDTNFNGDTSLQFRLWDMNTSYVSGTQGISIIGDTSFSADIGTAELDIEPVNDSPILHPGLTFTTIYEDILTGVYSGMYVSDLITDYFTDVDLGYEMGVAVIGTDRRNGRWWYTCDPDLSNSQWNPFIGGYEYNQVAPLDPKEAKATLLISGCRIRFLADENFNTDFDLNGDPRPESDTPYIVLKAWDNTGVTHGLSGQYSIDTTSNPDDHTNAFSRYNQTATIKVTSRNDRPVVQLDGDNSDYETTFVEPVPPERIVIPVPMVNPDATTVTDVDHANLTFAQASLIVYDGEDETLLYNTTGTALNDTLTRLTFGGDDYIFLRFEPKDGATSTPIADFQTVIRTLQYANSAEEPNNTTREISLFVDDGKDFSTTVQSLVRIELTNDPPELDLNVLLNGTYNLVNYTEGQGPAYLLDSDLQIIDHDHTMLHSVSIAITEAHDQNNETLSVDNIDTNITFVYQNFTLTLEGPATIPEFIDMLQSVTYNNSLSHPGNPSDETRLIEVVANDGVADSFVAIIYLSFTVTNNKPILDNNGNNFTGFDYRTTFYEEEGPVLAVSPDATVIDVDNETLAYILVTIDNPIDQEHETLQVENVTEYIGDPLSDKYTVCHYMPSQYFNVTTSTLRVSSLDTVYEYQQVLRTLKYNNSADEPDNTTRMLSFVVSDGLSLRTGVTTSIDIVNINDSPYIDDTALLYHPQTFEDISNSENNGWSLESMMGGVILDDDANSIKGVAIVGVATSNGHWEYTIDYKVPISDGDDNSGSGDVDNSGSGGSGDDGDNSGSGFVDQVMSAMGMDGSGSGDVESGSGVFDASAMGSGDAAPNDQTTWYPLPSNTTLEHATVLRINGSTSRVRFVPYHNFNGNITVTMVAWDATDGLKDGTITDATSQSSTDPFSSQSVTLVATVAPVNDAPVLSIDSVAMTTIKEDDTASFGNEIFEFVINASDVDVSDTILGIAIIEVDSSNGSWQYTVNGGISWITASAVDQQSAVLLSSYPKSSNRIRFLPGKDFNGQSSFDFIAWDLTSGQKSGTSNVDILASDPVMGAYSITMATATIVVDPVNDSPVISPGMALSDIDEDVLLPYNDGTLVSDIIAGHYTDIDVGADTGLAVIEVDIRNGTWEYLCPNMEDWMAFIGNYIYGYYVPPLPLPDQATLLLSNCRVRFLPDYLFNTKQDLSGFPRPASDTPYIVVRGWDNTGLSEGKLGQYGVNTLYHNTSALNEFSAETERVTVTVNSINNPALLKISSQGLSLSVDFTEDDSYVRIVEPEYVSLTDVDHIYMEYIDVVIFNVYDSFDESISIVPLPDSDTVDVNETEDTISVTLNGVTRELEMLSNISYGHYVGEEKDVGILTWTIQSAYEDVEVRKEYYEEALRHLVYMNDNTEPVNVTRLISFFVSDSESVTSNANTDVHFVLLAENAPILETLLYDITFTEGDASPIPLVGENLTLYDEDHNEFFYMASAEIIVLPIPLSEEERVSVDLLEVPAMYNITQMYNPVTGSLYIDGDAPVSVYQSLLRTAVYHNTLDEPPPGVRNISLQVADVHGLFSNIEYVSIDVSVINDQTPVITVADAAFVYTEHLVDLLPLPISISENLTVSDRDSGGLPLYNLTITITNPSVDDDYEVLNATAITFVDVAFDDYDLTLLLTGPASLDDFNAVLSTLTYVNFVEEPINELRELELVACDESLCSMPEYIYIDVLLLNDAPVIDLNGPRNVDINYMLEYEEGSGFVSIVNATEMIIFDNDDDYLTGATVTILNLLDGPNELLSVTLLADSSIDASYSTTTGELVLTGNATVAEYQDIIRTVVYANLEAYPGSPNTTLRRIAFVVYDAVNASNAALTRLAFKSVNDAPLLDLNGEALGTSYAVDFIEEGEGVVITDANMTLEDVDSQQLQEVYVRIVNCLDGDDYEYLNVDDDSCDLVDISCTASTCSYNITGIGTVQEFRDILAAVTYTNVADEPNTTPRTIEVLVFDDQGAQSDPQITTVSMISVNDPPRLYIATRAGIINVNVSTPAPPDPTMGPNPASGSGAMSGLGSGSMSGSGLDSISGSGLDSMSGSGLDSMSGLGSGFGMDDSSDSLDDMVMDMEDMVIMLDTNVTGADLFVMYTEGSPAIPIVQPDAVDVQDDDNMFIERVQIIIENVSDEGYETVFFNEAALSDPALIVGLNAFGYAQNGCPTDGPLVTFIDLQLTLTLSQTKSIIRSLYYCNSHKNPTADNRTITFRIQDPVGDWSSNRTTIVQVIPVNDAPIYAPLDSFEYLIEILEDHNVTVSVLENFYDHEENLTGSAIEVVRIVPDIGEAVVDPATGDITYSPGRDDNGIRIIYYQACDSHKGINRGCSTIENLTIVIAAVNDPPYAADDLLLEILEDESYVVDLTEYFGDVEDDLIPDFPYPTIELVTDGFDTSRVSAVLINNTHFEIASTVNSNGQAVIGLKVTDSVGAFTIVPITVVIQPVNDPPEIDVNDIAIVTSEDTPINISISLFDVESNLTTIMTVSVLSHGNGTVDVGPVTDLSIVPGNEDIVHRRGALRQDQYVTYTPDPDFYGDDTIVIYVMDSENGITERSISLTVQYVNDQPRFAITEIIGEEDTPLIVSLPGDLGVTDPEDDLHAGSFTIIQYAQHGNLSLTYNETYFNVTRQYPPVATLTYIPDPHYYSTNEQPEYFVLQACDNDTVTNKLCTNITITITVRSSNDAPLLPYFEMTINEDSELVFNLSEQAIDIEEGTPPLKYITIIPPFVKNGDINYDNSTGILTYTPYHNYFGSEEVYFLSCDLEMACNESGHFRIIVNNVNDKPVASDATVDTYEDDFALIDIDAYTDDNETNAEGDLKISLVDTNGDYVDELITTAGASLRVYQAHGIVTFEPVADFVGTDSFMYVVCDFCDPNRDAELGRTGVDPECERQFNENGQSRTSNDGLDIACAAGVVSINVINTNDVPIIRDITAISVDGQTVELSPFITSQVMNPVGTVEYLYSNSTATVFDADDMQLINAVQEGLDLAKFKLSLSTDIDESSLKVDLAGSASEDVRVANGSIIYVPKANFSGYDNFLYEVCDKADQDDGSVRCSQAAVRIFVPKPGPEILSVRAISSLTNGYDTDSKVSVGDRLMISFDVDTNRPYHTDDSSILSSTQINRLFDFPHGFISSDLVNQPYTGIWRTAREFELMIVDTGYPQPESKVGVWQIAVRSIDETECGGFDANGQVVSVISDNCLLTADLNSKPSSSLSPPLTGDWGKRLPDISNLIIRNPAVDDSVQVDDTNSLVYVQSHIALRMMQPLSYSQLNLYCEQDGNHILDANSIGSRVVLEVVGCNNLMPDGSAAEVTLADQIEIFNNYVSQFERQRRQAAVTEMPVVSEVVLQIVSFESLHDNSRVSSDDFINGIVNSLNKTTLIYVIHQLLGIEMSLLDEYNSDIPPDLLPVVGVCHENDDQLTPVVISAEADDPNCVAGYGTGDTITITFDRDTDEPAVTAKTDIDKIMTFSPSIGLDYTGVWTSPTTLVITIESLAQDFQDPAQAGLTISFTENTPCNNATTNKPQCLGTNVCGGSGQTIGVCNSNGLSCRAYTAHNSLTGSFDGLNCLTVPVPSRVWIYIVVAIVVAIVIVIIVVVVYACYRKQKQKKQREEAIRVVNRWKKKDFSPARQSDAKDGDTGPWAKPPGTDVMRQSTDPFKDKGPLKNLPDLARPPTAAPAENLPPIDTLPAAFKPREGMRPPVPGLPNLQPLPLQKEPTRQMSLGGLPSLTPLGLPRLTTQNQPPLSPVDERPVLGALKGGLNYYAGRALGEQRSGSSIPAAPGGVYSQKLPPLQPAVEGVDTGLPTVPPQSIRRLPSIPAIPVRQPSLPALRHNKVSPFTSSDENVAGTSDTDGGTVTSEGGVTTDTSGGGPPALIPLSPHTSKGGLPGVGRPSLSPQKASIASLPPVMRPAMPSRKTSVDPFATPALGPIAATPTTRSPLNPLGLPRSITASGLGAPILLPIPHTTTEEKEDVVTSQPTVDT